MFNLFNTHLNLDEDGAGGGGDEFPAYQDQMVDELKQDKDIAKNKTISDLGRDYKARGATIATQLETIANIPKAPENAEGYEFAAIEYPEGFENDPEFDKAYRGVVLEAKLTKEQADAVFQFFGKTVVGQFNAAKQKFDTDKTAADDALKQEWPGDEYAKNMTLKGRYLEKFGDEEMQKDLDSTGMGNKPSFLRHAVRVAKAVGEDSLGPGGPKPAEEAGSEKEKTLRSLYPSMGKIPTHSDGLNNEADDLKKMYGTMK